MGSWDHQLKEIKQFIRLCGEDYMISYANKGLYKRALKEIDKGMTMDWEEAEDEESLQCQLSDGATCHIGTSFEKSKCSCPSKSICKHILTAILLLQSTWASDDGVNENQENNERQPTGEEIKDPFEYMTTLDIGEQIQRLDQKQVEEILFRLDQEINYEITSKTTINIHLYDDIKVIFPPLQGLDAAICSKKCEGICHHKIEALLHALVQLGRLTTVELKNLLGVKWQNEEKKCLNKEALQPLENLLYKMTKLGLSRLPETILVDLEQYTLLCGRLGYRRLEKMVRSLQSLLKEYFQHHTAFYLQKYLSQMTRLYLVIKSLQTTDDYYLLKQLIGESKTRYIPIGNMTLHGIGSATWKNGAGYEGMTFYFYEEKSCQFYSFNEMMPTYYDTKKPFDMKTIYYRTGTWGLCGSMKEASTSTISLKGCRINRHNRLSTSKETQGGIHEPTSVFKLNFHNHLYKEWHQLRSKMGDKFIYTIEEQKELDRLVILEPESYGEALFDEINQELSVEVFDHLGDCLNILIPYNNQNKHLIEAFEEAVKKSALGERLLAKVFKREGIYYLHPITFYYQDGTIENMHGL